MIISHRAIFAAKPRTMEEDYALFIQGAKFVFLKHDPDFDFNSVKTRLDIAFKKPHINALYHPRGRGRDVAEYILETHKDPESMSEIMDYFENKRQNEENIKKEQRRQNKLRRLQEKEPSRKLTEMEYFENKRQIEQRNLDNYQPKSDNYQTKYYEPDDELDPRHIDDRRKLRQEKIELQKILNKIEKGE